MTAFSNSPTRRLRRLRRPLAAAVGLLAAIALAACGTPAPAETDDGGDTSLRIAFSPFTLQVPALKGLADALQHVAEGQGDTFVTAEANADPSTQLQQIQQWVELDQVDAIWVIPIAAQAVAPALQAAVDKGIVVVASGVPADYGFEEGMAGITFANVDNADYGAKLGGLAADCVTERLDGAGQMIYLQSPIGSQSSDSINDAVKAALAEGAPDNVIVNSQDAKDRLGSQQLVSSALQGAPGTNAVIGTDDESSLGALDAFKQAGIDPTATCIIGAGGNDEAKAAVDAGELYGVVAFDFQADLGQNLAELHALALDPTAAGRQITTPILVVTQ